MTCYEIAVGAPLRKTLTYAHPPPPFLTELIEPGRRVLVPLGRRLVTGYVLAVADEAAAGRDGIELNPIAELLDQGPLFFPAMMPFFR